MYVWRTKQYVDLPPGGTRGASKESRAPEPLCKLIDSGSGERARDRYDDFPADISGGVTQGGQAVGERNTPIGEKALRLRPDVTVVGSTKGAERITGEESELRLILRPLVRLALVGGADLHETGSEVDAFTIKEATQVDVILQDVSRAAFAPESKDRAVVIAASTTSDRRYIGEAAHDLIVLGFVAGESAGLATNDDVVPEVIQHQRRCGRARGVSSWSPWGGIRTGGRSRRGRQRCSAAMLAMRRSSGNSKGRPNR